MLYFPTPIRWAHVRYGDVACLDSLTLLHGIGHDLGVGPPTLVKSKSCIKCGKISTILSKGGYIPTKYFGLKGDFMVSRDVVDLYKNDEESKTLYS
jgi:hypothetical protein